MNLVEALRRLDRMGVESFGTRDAGALLGVTPANASVILARLSKSHFVVRLARGRWALSRTLQRAMLAEHLAAPYPAYLSLQTALFQHGLIEQMPAVLYAVTVGRTRRIDTPEGTVSFHHVPAKLFTGFEVTAEGAKLATPEKALFDLFYLAPGRSRLFSTLPEIDVPPRFRWSELDRYAQMLPESPRRSFISRRVASVRASSRKR